jgi:hypothetical protein
LPQNEDKAAIVWYLYQEWGRAGTAGSFFVPKVFELKAYEKGVYSAFNRTALPPDVKTWPIFEGLSYGVPSFVAAGIQSLDANPIRAAIPMLEETSVEHLKYVGLPFTKEGLNNLATAIETAGPTLQEFYRP